jgi:hypothetical protein
VLVIRGCIAIARPLAALLLAALLAWAALPACGSSTTPQRGNQCGMACCKRSGSGSPASSPAVQCGCSVRPAAHAVAGRWLPRHLPPSAVRLIAVTGTMSRYYAKVVAEGVARAEAMGQVALAAALAAR